MKIKVYIESSPSVIGYAMVDFCKSLSEGNVNYFLTSQVELNSSVVEAYAATVIKFDKNNIKDILMPLCHSLLEQSSIVEFHVGISFSKQLYYIFKNKKHHKNNVRLYFYDDGYYSVLTRKKLASLPGVKRFQALQSYAASLRNDLFPNHKKQNESWIEKNGWNPIFDYVWGLVYTAKYYSAEVDKHREAGFQFHQLDVLTADEKRIYCQLFNVSESEYQTLLEKYNDNVPLLFVASANIQVREMLDPLRANGVLHQAQSLIVWGISGSNVPASLAGYPAVVPVNNTIPLVSLKVLGLLPARIIGELSDELYLFPGANIAATFISAVDTKKREKEEVAAQLGMLKPDRHYVLNEIVDNAFPFRIFRCAASMGDVIYALGAIRALRAQFNEKFIFIGNKILKDLVESCPDIDEFWSMDQITDKRHEQLSAANINRKYHILDRWDHILAHRHMTDAFLADFGGEWQNQERLADIRLTQLDTRHVDEFIARHQLDSGNVVLLHPNIGAPNRTWTEQGWNDMAESFLSAGWQVVIIGSDRNIHSYKSMMHIRSLGVINAVNEFSILETIYFMQHAQLLVACDSGPVALAGLTSIAICALYSLIPFGYRLPIRKGIIGWNALGIDVGCARFGQCGALFAKSSEKLTGDNFAIWCPNGQSYSCLRNYSSRQLIQKINEFISSDSYIPNNL